MEQAIPHDQQAEMVTPSLIRAAALDALIAELGADFSSFVTPRELTDMLDERGERILRQRAQMLAA